MQSTQRTEVLEPVEVLEPEMDATRQAAFDAGWKDGYLLGLESGYKAGQRRGYQDGLLSGFFEFSRTRERR